MNPPAQKPAAGLTTMTMDDINAYLARLAKDEVTLTGLEATVAKKLRAKSGQVQRLAAEHKNCREQIAKLQERAQHLEMELLGANGETEGYVGLLTSAEDERRTQAARTPKLQAVQLVEGEGAAPPPAPPVALEPPGVKVQEKAVVG